MSPSKSPRPLVVVSCGVFVVALCSAGCGSSSGGGGSGGKGTAGSAAGGSGTGGSASGGSGTGGSASGGSGTGGAASGGSNPGGSTAAGGATSGGGSGGGGGAGVEGGRGGDVGSAGGRAGGGAGRGGGTAGAGGAVAMAQVMFTPIAPGTITGTAVFTPVANGVQVVVTLANCPTGAHPIHIHEGMSCTSATTQGMHWGGTGGPGEDIGPNGGEITCNAAMTGTLTYIRMNTPAAKAWTIGVPAATNIIDHAMIVHSSTTATDRHACGVIQAN